MAERGKLLASSEASWVLAGHIKMVVEAWSLVQRQLDKVPEGFPTVSLSRTRRSPCSSKRPG
jgi:hypothetical protein